MVSGHEIFGMRSTCSTLAGTNQPISWEEITGFEYLSADSHDETRTAAQSSDERQSETTAPLAHAASHFKCS